MIKGKQTVDLFDTDCIYIHNLYRREGKKTEPFSEL